MTRSLFSESNFWAISWLDFKISVFLTYWWISVAAIFIVLFARFISIWIPSLIVPFKPRLSRGSITLLVWGGLRGGVSIALVISVTHGAYAELLLEMTYLVVVFSIVVQGLTVGKLSGSLLKIVNRKIEAADQHK